jgi:AraC-like DNA-binding protein
VARAVIERWVPLAQAAIDAGLADQRHLTRQFKQAYCLTPAAGRTPSDSAPPGGLSHPSPADKAPRPLPPTRPGAARLTLRPGRYEG